MMLGLSSCSLDWDGYTFAVDSGAGSGDGRDLGRADAGVDAGADAARDGGRDGAAQCAPGGGVVCFLDADGDGYAAEGASSREACEAGCPPTFTRRAPVAAARDCDDENPDIHPGAVERCNDLSDDCDVTVDEGASASCQLEHASSTCSGGLCQLLACAAGYDDCDDEAATGCEQGLTVAAHCGRCGRACPALSACVPNSGAIAGCRCLEPAFERPPAAGELGACEGPAPLAVGQYFTCAIAEDQSLACFGDMPAPEASLRYVTAGHGSAASVLCGVSSAGAIACYTQDGSYGEPPEGTDFASVALASNLCGIDSAGVASCTGTASERFPSDGARYRQIVNGLFHTCALRQDGAVVCYGYGKDADRSNCAVNYECGQSLPPLGPFVQISAGLVHTCGLRPNGSVECWGAGEGTTQGSFPNWGQAHPPPEAMRWIHGDANRTCGIRAADDTIVCWGEPFSNGSTVSPPTGQYQVVVVGITHACALSTAGDIDCFGDLAGGTTPVPAHIAGPFPRHPRGI